ncbi:MAG: hypothetical protein IJD63_03525 [Oscillospiraceae bacterium]|nr:hypothetical protein [Oscillospiraceae bacterium]
MEKRVHFFVSKRNALTWLMAICMVCSAVARIVLIGLKGSDGELQVWNQIVLPIVAALLYAVICIANGKERFYKTAIPFWMLMAYYVFNFANHNLGLLMTSLFAIVLVFIAFCYTRVTSGREKFILMLILQVSFPMAVELYLGRSQLLAGNFLHFLPDGLMTLGLLFTIFAIRVHPAGEYHPTWGDRIDGRKIRTLSPMAQITMYFQWERNICSNLFEESIEITHIDRYIRQKRREGLTDFGITHVLLAAYVRGVAKYPQLNRFISGQKVYSRGEDIQYCMVVKKEMTVESPDTSIKVHLNPRDTAEDVYRKLNAAIADVKRTQELDSNFDSLIQYFNLIPGLLLKFVVWFLKFLDYFGLLPKFLLELSPFHGSLFFTSMGSLGIQPIYHHLYDFGNLPAFGAFGAKRKALEVQEDGTVVQRKYVDIKFVLDERICDGFYYATFFKYYKRLLRNPEILDQPPEEVVQDIE